MMSVVTARLSLGDLLRQTGDTSGRAMGVAKYRSLDTSPSLGLTVPRIVRAALDWKKGDTILLSVSDQGTLIGRKFEDEDDD